MKLVRFGAAGAERPGLVNADGSIADLSTVYPGCSPAPRSHAESLAKLRALDASQTTARADRRAPRPCVGGRRQVHRHRSQLRRSCRRNRRQDPERAHRVHEGHELHRRSQRHGAEAARLDQDGLGSRARRGHRQRHALRQRGGCAEPHRRLLRDQRSVRARISSSSAAASGTRARAATPSARSVPGWSLPTKSAIPRIFPCGST